MARGKTYAGFSLFALKIIGILAMLSSHVVIVFFDKLPYDTALWMYYIGRLAFPIFAFSIANGWRRTRSRLFYILKVLIMAVVSQIPYSLALYGASFDKFKSFFLYSPLNIGFTFLLAMLCLWIYDILRKIDFPCLIAAVCAILPAICFEFLTPFHVDYGYAGVLLILVMYITYGDTPMMFFSAATVFAWMCATVNNFVMGIQLDVFLCYILSLVLLLLYNGRLGARAKYMFYIFYPLHLLVLYLLDLSIF